MTAAKKRPLPDIEHGTMRGWRQHTRRRIPACEPCIEARRRSEQPPASPEASAWNEGHYGPGKGRGRSVPAPKVDASDERKAALVVADQARDAADCRRLLDMVGLLPNGDNT